MPYVPDRIFKTNLIGGRGGKGRLTKFETINLIIGFPATCPPEISVSESHGGLLRVLRPGWGEGPLSRRDAKVPILGLTCGYIRILGWKTETRSYASILVSEGPPGTYGVVACANAAFKLDEVPKTLRDAARNATGATFAGH